MQKALRPPGGTIVDFLSVAYEGVSEVLLDVTVVTVESVLIIVTAVYAAITGNVPISTTPRVRSAMLRLAPDRLDGTVYELGAGWGSLAVSLARRYPNRSVVAFELSPVPCIFVRLRALFAGMSNLTVRRASFWQATLGDAGLVTCYLSPRAMARLAPKLAAELPPGTPVISNNFAIPGWRPAVQRQAQDLQDSTVYLYASPGPME